MIVTKNKEEDLVNKLSVSKQVTSSLSDSLQLLNERFMACIKNVDSTEIEEVDYANSLIEKFNDLIDFMSKNQNNSFNRLNYIKLTDDYGNVANDYKIWVVGEEYFEDGKPTYYKRRFVRARTPKESIYKYKQVDKFADTSISCIGEKDGVSPYCFGVENEEIIE